MIRAGWAGISAAALLGGVAFGGERGGDTVGLTAHARLALDPANSALAEPSAGVAPGDTGSADLAQQLQNPVADLISVPLQFNYDEAFGERDGGRLTRNVQPVIPFSISDEWNVISRTIVPVLYAESAFAGDDSGFALGDTLQSLFLSPKKPVGGWVLGVGPVALLPTGTEPGLRGEQLGLGVTGVALRQRGGWTYGALTNHVWGVTDPDGIDRVSASFVQPFVTYTWPSATTLALNAEMTYDWNESELTLPFNLVVSQLTTLAGRPVTFFVGGRYYADAPAGGPEWGVRFGMTFLFPK